MVQPNKQEGLFGDAKTRIVISKSFDAKKDKEPYSIATARKSSIEARGVCAKCGLRVGRDDLEACPHCGSFICKDCKRLAKRRARQQASNPKG